MKTEQLYCIEECADNNDIFYWTLRSYQKWYFNRLQKPRDLWARRQIHSIFRIIPISQQQPLGLHVNYDDYDKIKLQIDYKTAKAILKEIQILHKTLILAML